MKPIAKLSKPFLLLTVDRSAPSLGMGRVLQNPIIEARENIPSHDARFAFTDSFNPTGEIVKFTLSQTIHDSEWDNLLNQVPGAHFEQTSAWGAVKAKYGWRVLRLTASLDNRYVGGVQLLLRTLGHVGVIGYVSRGPVTASGFEALAAALVKRLEHKARLERWLYLVYDHAYTATALAQRMANSGYRPHPTAIPPSGLMTATLVLDLRRTEDEIWAGLSRHTRRNIRRAQRAGLTFQQGDAADLPAFRQLMLATCRRRGTAPTPPQEDFFQNVWGEFSAQGTFRLFKVCHQQELVCAVAAFTVSDTIRVWKTGWSGEHEDKYPNYFRVWEIIRWAKQQGFREFDFVWLDSEDARLAADKRNICLFRDGSTAFKLGFGGRLMFLPTAQSRFFHPLIRAAFFAGGSRILNSVVTRKLLRRFWLATVNT